MLQAGVVEGIGRMAREGGGDLQHEKSQLIYGNRRVYNLQLHSNCLLWVYVMWILAEADPPA